MKIEFTFTPKEEELLDFFKKEKAGFFEISETKIPDYLGQEIDNFLNAGLIKKIPSQGHGNLSFGHNYRFTDVGAMVAELNPVEMEDAGHRIDRGEDAFR